MFAMNPGTPVEIRGFNRAHFFETTANTINAKFGKFNKEPPFNIDGKYLEIVQDRLVDLTFLLLDFINFYYYNHL